MKYETENRIINSRPIRKWSYEYVHICRVRIKSVDHWPLKKKDMQLIIVKLIDFYYSNTLTPPPKGYQIMKE